jgi:hypothetical protein
VNGTGAVVRGFGRTAAGEVEQENALVTAVCFCIKLSSGYAIQHLTFSHGTCEANQHRKSSANHNPEYLWHL